MARGQVSPGFGPGICLLRHQDARARRPAAEGSRHYGDSAEMFGSGTVPQRTHRICLLYTSHFLHVERDEKEHRVEGGPRENLSDIGLPKAIDLEQ